MKSGVVRRAFVLSCALFRFAIAQTSFDSTPQQNIVSFGASGAWWPNDLINFPVQVQNTVGELLFSPSGLWLSNYRYNVGGGGVNVTAPRSVVQSFLQPDGSYDWSKDKGGVTFLKMAQSYGVPSITFFVNSPPPPVALNGASCGWDMTSGQVGTFATYLATVVSHWKNEGINVAYLSPMNEPDNNRASCTQEGMGVGIGLRAPVFKAVQAALSDASVGNVGIIGDETSWLIEAEPEYPLWLPAAVDSLSAIAVHNYDFPPDAGVSFYSWVASKTSSSRLPIRFTETCCSTSSGSGPLLFAAQYDPTITGALVTSRYIWQFLTIANAESFDWWTALSSQMGCSPSSNSGCATTVNSAGFNDALIYFDPSYSTSGDTTLYISKRYWALRHFSYFIRPGATRFNVVNPPSGVVAISTLNGGVWHALFINDQTNAVNFNLTLPGTNGVVTQIAYTTAHDDWATGPLPPVVSNSVLLSLAAQSLFSIQFTVSGGPSQKG